MCYEIGQTLPYTRPRGITGEPLAKAVWHALTVPPGREKAARQMLENNGVHAQYPVREKHYRQRGKSIVRKLPIITQVVYARFKAAPQWDVMKSRRLIVGVYGVGDTPVALPDAVVRAVMGMPTVEEELEAARQEMMRIRAGDTAEILSGPLSGFVVNVDEVRQGRAWFSTLTGVKGDVAVGKLEKKNCDL